MTNQEAARKLFDIKHDNRFSWTQESVDAFDLAISALYDLVISSLEKRSKKSSDTRKDPGEPTSILDALLYPNQSTLEIPPAIPATCTSEECEDAVSRREVIDFVNSITNLDPKAKGGIVLSVKFMKPVTPKPKTGKWIEHSFSEDGKARLIECSECGAAYVVNCLRDYSIFVEGRKYCNKCGAKMEAAYESMES